jgi:hypothetical protein
MYQYIILGSLLLFGLFIDDVVIYLSKYKLYNETINKITTLQNS